MKVTIFSTCLVDMMFPHVGQAMVEVLERLGCETTFPEDQVCCGQPTYNSGYHKKTRPAMINQLKAFKDAEYVVGPSGSCVAMLKEYKKIFKDDPQYAQIAADLYDKTYEFSQFLIHILKIQDVGATLHANATFHRSCHMSRLLGVKSEPDILLNHVTGLKMIPLPHIENCCGFGGTFSVKMPEISQQMVHEKMIDILSTGAKVLIAAETGCLMNIGGYFNRTGHPIKLMHLAEVLNSGF